MVTTATASLWKREPLSVGADLIAGSLIKNPGGGIAPTGGYIAGRADLVELCANRLNAPGVGKELGATLGHSKELFMGNFQRPTSREALKTAAFAAGLFSRLGFSVTPTQNEKEPTSFRSSVSKGRTLLSRFARACKRVRPLILFVTPSLPMCPDMTAKLSWRREPFISELP